MGTHPIFESDFDCLTEVFLKMLSRLAVRTVTPQLRRLTLTVAARPAARTQLVQQRKYSVMQWLKGEPFLEQLLFVLMGGFLVMLFCQVFLGSAAIGSVPRRKKPAPQAYENELNFGLHPVEKILMEETGVTSPEEAKPILKAYWANKIANMSEEEVQKLKEDHLFRPKFEALERAYPTKNPIP